MDNSNLDSLQGIRRSMVSTTERARSFSPLTIQNPQQERKQNVFAKNQRGAYSCFIQGGKAAEGENDGFS